MPIIIIFIIIAITVSVAGALMNGDPSNPGPEGQQQEETINPTNYGTGAQNGQSSGSKQTQTVDPNFPINTYIKYGPVKKDVFTDTTEVVFEFDAVISSSVNLSDLYFETKAEGVDSDWQRTSQRYRKVTFPDGQHQYTFRVRGRTNSLTEPTPASMTVTINVSPYYNEFKISNVRPPDNLANPSLITISNTLQSGQAISISGWTLTGEKGTVVIPSGAEKYDPNNSSSWGQSITVKPGDIVYVSSEASPFAFPQLSFRPNKCMGYYYDSKDFELPIYKNCPMPVRESLPNYLSTKCKSFIMSEIGLCEFPSTNEINEYDLYKEDSCVTYLTMTFNYAGCLQKYGNDSNFASLQWHVYTDRTEKEIMNRFGDTVYLRDLNGLVVSKYCFEEYCD